MAYQCRINCRGIRVANPLVRDLVMTVYDAGAGAYYSLARSVGLVDFPVPPMSNMRKTSSPSLSHYLETAVKTALPIQTGARLAGYHFEPGSRVLDFGAGVGRQIKYFRDRFQKVEYHACDVEPSHAGWLARAYPDVTTRINSYAPPLDYPADTFDMIYSVASYTHMEPAACDLWLDEFARILKPGGIVCLTVIGVAAMRKFAAWFSETDVVRLEERGFHHTDYDIAASRDVASRRRFLKYTEYLAHCGEHYGQTFFTRGHIERAWPRSGLELVDIAEGVVDDLQDLVILRKQAAS